MSSNFSNIAISGVDVNFNNPKKTAGCLFFNIEKGAKKTDNNVAKVRDCLIDVHLEINNLPACVRSHLCCSA